MAKIKNNYSRGPEIYHEQYSKNKDRRREQEDVLIPEPVKASRLKFH